MSFRKALYFLEAVRWLGCSPQWLTRQIDKGLVRFTLESDGKGAHRYRLNRDDLDALRESIPTWHPQPTKEVAISTPIKQRTARHKAELMREARELGMTLEEYLSVLCR